MKGMTIWLESERIDHKVHIKINIWVSRSLVTVEPARVEGLTKTLNIVAP